MFSPTTKLRELGSLDPHVICIAIIGFTLFVISSYAIGMRMLHLKDIHGPWWAAYTRFWILKTIASGDCAEKFVHVNNKYGPLARIGPNHLLTDDPELMRRILAARSRYTRGPWFDSLKIDPHVPTIISERDPEKHNHLRHQMSAGFAGKDIEGLESAIDERFTEWVSRIDQNWVSQPGESKIFDIATKIQYLAVDTITHLCFGKPLGFIEADSDLGGFLATIENRVHIVQHLSVLLEINTVILRMMDISWLKKLLLPSALDKTGIGKIIGICRKVVDQRFEPNAIPQKYMLGSFLSHGLTRSEAEMEMLIPLIAGLDTTATAMRATLLAIITNPGTYNKLQNEIDTAISRGAISPIIQDAEARQLPYLQACIIEGLRKFSPISLLRERMTPPEGDHIHGHAIPGGVFIGLNVWGVQLNPVFGSDVEIFRPERWLIEDLDQLRKMHRTHELIFGYGSTKCLGIPISAMNLNKVFVELLRRFDITVANPMKPWTSVCYGIFF